MPVSTCFDLWEEWADGRGGLKWVNAGHAPDGACPACAPTSGGPQDGDWNGYSAGCSGGNIVKFVYDSTTGGLREGGVLLVNSPACIDSRFVGSGSLSDYFP